MKKKSLKIIVSILVILLIAILVNSIRTYTILNKFQNTFSEKIKNANNFYYEFSTDLDTNSSFRKVYHLDNTYKVVELAFNDFFTMKFNDSGEILEQFSTDESYSTTPKQILEEKNSFTTLPVNFFKHFKLKHLILPILVENNYYKLNFDNATYYINKENYLLEKVQFPSAYYKILFDVVNSSNL